VRKFWFETPLGKARLEEINAQQPAVSRPAAPRGRARMYSGAKSTRFTDGWNAANTSADAELRQSLTMMRSRSRALVRDASYALAARRIVVNNVIGSGIGLQSKVRNSRDGLNDRVNDEIETVFDQWCKADRCHTGGRLHFAHLERQLVGQVFEAGDVCVRIHLRKFGTSEVPLCLEVIEAERLADELTSHNLAGVSGNQIRLGVEVDVFFRPVAYWFRRTHPNEIRFAGDPDLYERVPADQVIHLAIIDRWPQSRGNPWMHTVLRRLNDMEGYSEAEIVRARGQAVRMGIIETSEDADSLAEQQDDGSYEMGLEPGVVTRLNPGEKWQDSNPTAPNPQLDPFMRYMLREMAAGTGVSYESLSKDYSQSNYSSSRLALLDDRDLWRFLQLWFIRDFRTKVHSLFLRQAVLAGALKSFRIDEYAVDPCKFECVRYKPRGWSWIDPTREVTAYKEAITAGLTTLTDVIAKTADGRDIEDVLNERAEEIELMREKGLVFDTSPEVYNKPEPAAAPAPGKAADPPTDPDADDEDEPKPAPRRVFPFQR
jgi:lambda family phage portal protein